MNIAFNRKLRRSPWGGGSQFLTAFVDHLNNREDHNAILADDVIVKDIDNQRHWSGHLYAKGGLHWIVMLDPRDEEGAITLSDIKKSKQNHGTKVLHRVNDTGKTRGGPPYDALIMQENAIADYTVFISEWVKQYFVARGFNTTRPHSVIENGCDTHFFHHGELRELTRPYKLVTHHWSPNVAKGLDLYRHIDELIDAGAPIEFTYIGRYPTEHVPKHTKLIEPCYGEKLGDMLREHDVYVTAARWEACGSHHVEGAACGLPVIYHKDGGGVNDMCRRYGVEISSPTGLQMALKEITLNYEKYRIQAISTDLSAKTMCEKYIEAMLNHS